MERKKEKKKKKTRDPTIQIGRGALKWMEPKTKALPGLGLTFLTESPAGPPAHHSLPSYHPGIQ